MDVEYAIYVMRSESATNYLVYEFHRRNDRMRSALDRMALDVFIMLKGDVKPMWYFHEHKAGSWYDEHLEYSNRLN